MMIDKSVKEMPKNPFQFIWEVSENLLSGGNKKQQQLPTPASSCAVTPSPHLPQAGAHHASNDEVTTTISAAHNPELNNPNTLSVLTLETSVTNTSHTANDGSKEKKSAASKKTTSSRSSSSASPQERLFLVDEFNKHQQSSSNISSALNDDSLLSVNNNSNNVSSKSEIKKSMTQVENSST